MAVGYDPALRNALGDAHTAFIGAGGKLALYSGVRPATGGAAGTLLATLTLGTPFAPATVAGVLTANAITPGVAVATGTVAWGRIFKADGVTKCIDVSVGTAAAEVIIANTSVVAGATISASSLVITIGNP